MDLFKSIKSVCLLNTCRHNAHTRTHARTEGVAVATLADFGALPRDPYVPQNVLGASL